MVGTGGIEPPTSSPCGGSEGLRPSAVASQPAPRSPEVGGKGKQLNIINYTERFITFSLGTGGIEPPTSAV